MSGKLKCPKCGGDCDAVKDSRPFDLYGAATVKRRRLCNACGHRISTFEISEDALAGMRRGIAKDLAVSLLSEMTK